MPPNQMPQQYPPPWQCGPNGPASHNMQGNMNQYNPMPPPIFGDSFFMGMIANQATNLLKNVNPIPQQPYPQQFPTQTPPVQQMPRQTPYPPKG